MLGREVNSKRPAGHVASHALGLLGDVGRVIVEDELDGGAGRISGIEKLEEFDELSASMRSLTRAWTLPVSRSIPANRLSVPWRLYS